MKHHESQRGQALVIFALAAIVLFGMAAIAVDQGFAAAQRRDIQAAVDQAALAGTRQYSQSSNNDLNGAHFVALKYLGSVLSFPVTNVQPVCIVTSCPGGTYGSPSACPLAPNTIGYCFTLADTGKILDISATQRRSTFLAGAIGLSQITVGTGARAKPNGPITAGASYNLATLGGDANMEGGGVKNAASGNVSGSVYVTGTYYGSTGGGGHADQIPNAITDGAGSVCPGDSANHVDFSGPTGNDPLADVTKGKGYGFTSPPNPPPAGSKRLNQPSPPSFDDPRLAPTVPSGTYNNSTSARDAVSGNWKPGTYVGFMPAPSHLLNPGVYKITQVTAGMDLRGLQQASSTNSATAYTYVAGAPNPTSAVAFVFNSTDTGSLTIDTATLNGYEGPLSGFDDTNGTHNFVLYGGPVNVGGVTSGYAGNITISPSSNIRLSGIVYLPNTSMTSHGDATWDFEGAVYVSSMTLDGGGHNTQVFGYICGLSANVGKGTDGGLIK